ncbi:AAA family ATPase [Persicobacter psychrovividus]|uniref:AAA+ ATPase domain-containing protein n=1 Tax=Persicobacter psychrovividus TaxID=387638 RepID=A0ABN6L6P4_9BACT|nr:hypothetical protein PEPS_11650 [Persicobacter psychrovividus]
MLIRDRIKKILEVIGDGMFEKEEVTSLGVLSAIAGESIFMLGPPGVGKSMIAKRLKHAFKEGRSFEYLMNRFSTPDEIFGPISIKKLSKEDKYERMTEGYLPGATVVFLDEIWKAGPAIQNALLTVLNEKIYRNGDKEIKVKLQALFSASNELPEENSGLEALWDRFLIRCFVDRILDEENFYRMLTEPHTSNSVVLEESLVIHQDEITEWDLAIEKVRLPKNILLTLTTIRKTIAKHGQGLKEGESPLYVSDRRWAKIARLLKTSAFLNGREEVNLADCLLISPCLWSKPSEIELTKKWVSQAIFKVGFPAEFKIPLVEAQINSFRSEVMEQAFEVKLMVENVPQVINGQYHTVMEFPGFHKNILAEDFELLSGSVQEITLYSTAGGEQTFKASKISNIEIEIEIKNHFQRFTLVNIEETVEKHIRKKVSPATIEILNKQKADILTYLDKVATTLVEVRETGKDHELSSIFLTKKQTQAMDFNLQMIMKEIVSRKTEVEKIGMQYA